MSLSSKVNQAINRKRNPIGLNLHVQLFIIWNMITQNAKSELAEQQRINFMNLNPAATSEPVLSMTLFASPEPIKQRLMSGFFNTHK